MKKNIKKYIGVLGVFFIITYIMYSMNFIAYDEIDDYMIQELYAGYYGVPDCHVIYINAILGKIFVFLFNNLRIVNWYALFLIISQMIIYSTITYKLIKRKHNKYEAILIGLIMIPIYCLFTIRLQYTIVAYSYLLLCLIYQIDYYRVKNKKNIVHSIICFSLGLMIRQDIITSYMIFELVIAICYIRKNIKIRISRIKTIIIVNIIMLLIYILFNIINQMFYLKGVNQYSYSYTKERGTLNDICQIRVYNDIIKNAGWTENDLQLFNYFTAGDDQIFSQDIIKSINEENKKLNGLKAYISKNNIFYKHWYMICQLKNGNKIIILKVLLKNSVLDIATVFLIINILLIMNTRRGITNKIMIASSGWVQYFIFAFINKLLFRVYCPVLFISTILLIYYSKIDMKKIIKYKISNIIFIAIMCFIFITFMHESIEKNRDVMNFEESYNKILSYTTNNKENAYIYSTFALQNRYAPKNILQIYEKGILENVHPLGSWSLYTEKYNIFKENYDINNLFTALVEKENVFYIDNNADSYLENVIIFLKEHYYEKDIEYNLIEEFGDLKIYKLYICD